MRHADVNHLTSKLAIHVQVFLRQNQVILGIFILWFLFGFLAFAYYFKLSPIDALLSAFYLRAHDSDPSTHFAFGYAMWGQGVIFGVVFGLLMQNALDRQNPERRCRAMAHVMRDHLIIIGYSHLGSCLVDYCTQHGIPYALIEKDREKVDELLRKGEAVIVDDATEQDALPDANVREAKAVIVASNNIDTALLVTKKVRDVNPACRMIVRCLHDELTEVLEALGANLVISSSKSALGEILSHLQLSDPASLAK